jgi:hypothetical protein
MPFLDAMTAGYVMKLHADVQVEVKPDGVVDFTWLVDDDPPISFHSYEQVNAIPGANSMIGGHPYKWMNPWHIETPPGYSVLVTQPLNHFEDRWEIMSGIVDTDTFNLRINFPFVWKDPKFKGIIKRGTPIAQVIPFKRETWEISVIPNEPKNERNNMLKISNKISDAYKTFWWQKKEWR